MQLKSKPTTFDA